MTYKQRLVKCYNCGTRWRDGLQYQNRRTGEDTGLLRSPCRAGISAWDPPNPAGMPSEREFHFGAHGSSLDHMAERRRNQISQPPQKPTHLWTQSLLLFPRFKSSDSLCPREYTIRYLSKRSRQKTMQWMAEAAGDWYLGVWAAASTRPAFKS